MTQSAIDYGLAGPPSPSGIDTSFDHWHRQLREAVSRTVTDFLRHRCADELRSYPDVFANVLVGFFDGGKCLRPTFMYLGWLCGADPHHAAVRASASLELLHGFALLQDDVMDRSPRRRGRPAAHLSLATWHREEFGRGLSERFGDSAAVLLSDLCLVWSAQLLRESGLDAAALNRAWPRYDAMRTELAAGQLAELLHDAQELPPLDVVLAVARRKSGNYTVRRPLEIGAVLADCPTEIITALGAYGSLVGEAFQLRDDLLGIFGTPSVTGKSASSDLSERKWTSVVVAAYELASAAQRKQLSELMCRSDLEEVGVDVDRCRALITATGAVQFIEEMIEDRVSRALLSLSRKRIDDRMASALSAMAINCTKRTA